MNPPKGLESTLDGAAWQPKGDRVSRRTHAARAAPEQAAPAAGRPSQSAGSKREAPQGGAERGGKRTKRSADAVQAAAQSPAPASPQAPLDRPNPSPILSTPQPLLHTPAQPGGTKRRRPDDSRHGAKRPRLEEAVANADIHFAARYATRVKFAHYDPEPVDLARMYKERVRRYGPGLPAHVDRNQYQGPHFVWKGSPVPRLTKARHLKSPTRRFHGRKNEPIRLGTSIPARWANPEAFPVEVCDELHHYSKKGVDRCTHIHFELRSVGADRDDKDDFWEKRYGGKWVRSLAYEPPRIATPKEEYRPYPGFYELDEPPYLEDIEAWNDVEEHRYLEKTRRQRQEAKGLERLLRRHWHGEYELHLNRVNRRPPKKNIFGNTREEREWTADCTRNDFKTMPGHMAPETPLGPREPSKFFAHLEHRTPRGPPDLAWLLAHYPNKEKMMLIAMNAGSIREKFHRMRRLHGHGGDLMIFTGASYAPPPPSPVPEAWKKRDPYKIYRHSFGERNAYEWSSWVKFGKLDHNWAWIGRKIF